MSSGVYRQYDKCESNTHQELSSTGVGDPKTPTVPRDTSGFWVSCKTTACRFTIDGSAPGASNGIVVPVATAPQFFPFGAGVTPIFCGDGGASVIDLMFAR